MPRQLTFMQKLNKLLSFGAGARIDCYTMISSLMAIMPLDNALRVIYDAQSDDQKRPDNGYAPIVREWRKALRAQGSDAAMRGTPFAAAVAPWVPNVDTRLLAAAERAGALDRAFGPMITFTKRSRGVTSAVLTALWSVVNNIGLLIAIMAGFSGFFAPILENIIPRRRWTGIGAVMGGAADVFSAVLPFAIPGLIIFTLASVLAMPRWTGGLRDIADRLPPFSWYLAWQGGLFLLEFSSMTNAGITDTDALSQIHSSAPAWLRLKVSAIMRELRAGASGIGEAAWRAGATFPGKSSIRVLRALGTDAAERMGEMSEMFITDAIKQIERSVGMIGTLAKLTLMVMILLIAAGSMSVITQILVQYGVRF